MQYFPFNVGKIFSISFDTLFTKFNHLLSKLLVHFHHALLVIASLLLHSIFALLSHKISTSEGPATGQFQTCKPVVFCLSNISITWAYNLSTFFIVSVPKDSAAIECAPPIL